MRTLRLILAGALVLAVQASAWLQVESFCGISGAVGASIGAFPQTSAFHSSDFATEPKYIKLYVHVIRQANGTGGQSDQAVQAALDRLNSDFNPHNIFFVTPCETIDISVSPADYVDFEFYCDLFANPSYDYGDGISVFFGANNTVRNGGSTVGGGVADNIPATKMWVAGSLTLLWNSPPCITTSIVSHEMGHCLGLWHTSHGTIQEVTAPCDGSPPEFYPNQNCELVNQYVENPNITQFSSNNGDFVTDTEADPKSWLSSPPNCTNFIFEQRSNSCIRTTVNDNACSPLNQICLRDENEDIYSPPLRNIMATPPNVLCLSEITQGQGWRIHKMIALTPALQACLVSPTVITQNTTWTTANTPNNGDFEVLGDLVIESGATLSVGAGVVVRFKQAGRVIVKPNATLTLQGKFKSGTCDTHWQGVEVWGNSEMSQYSINGTRAQGRFVGQPGSVIEHAVVGVRLWNPAEQKQTGGQISCYQTTFRNNTIAVDFGPYKNFWPYSTSQYGQPRDYFGSFSDCSFENNQTYPLGEPFDAFIKMIGVHGVKIQGCSFINSQLLSTCNQPADYGYGIHASDAGFRVESLCQGVNCSSMIRSSFSGLGYGVYNARIASNKPYMVKQVDFDNCYVGIHNNGVSNGTLLFNDFVLGSVPSVCVPNNQLGIVFENSIAGFSCEQNSFTGITGNVGTKIGILSKDIDEFNNVIRKNTYVGLDVGNLSNGKNATSAFVDRGLHYLCNGNLGVSSQGADFQVEVGSGLGRVRYSQGLGTEVTPGQITYRAAGNTFSHTGIDFNNQGDGIQYYYFPGNVIQVPLNYTGADVNVSSGNSCSNNFCEPPCKTQEEVAEEKEKYYADKALKENAKTGMEAMMVAGNLGIAEQLERQAAYYQEKQDKEAFMVVLHLVHDTLFFSQDTLDIWLENLDTYGADLFLAVQQQMFGQAAEAERLVQKASNREGLGNQQKEDLAALEQLLKRLKGDSPYNLTSQVLFELEQFTDLDESFTGNLARNILSMYGYDFPITFQFTPYYKEEKKDIQVSSSVASENWLIYPNPASAHVTVQWNPITADTEPAVLRIYDLTGKPIKQVMVSANEKTDIDTHFLSPGMYLYQLQTDVSVIASGKLIIH